MAFRSLRGVVLILAACAVCDEHASAAPDQPQYTIAFASFAPLNSDLFIADADGSNPRALVPHADLDANASFSPDGAWIVFSSRRAGSSDIYRVHPDGSGLEALVADPAFDDQATLSPDGKVLGFVSTRSGQADVWTLELATRKLVNVTNHPAGDFRPAWSPDGQWLAFSSDRESTKPLFGFSLRQSTEIFVVRRDGSDLRRLTRDQAFAGSPSWSQDGKRLLFYVADMQGLTGIVSPSRTRGVTQVATMNADGSDRRVLTTGPGEKWSPRWLKDGRVGYASGGPEGGLEFVDATAGARGEFRSPGWSPDGRRVVFYREVDTHWPPLRDWHSNDPQFRLIRTGVFPSASSATGQLICNDQTAGILHNSIVTMKPGEWPRPVLFGDPVKSALAASWSPQGDRVAFATGGFFQMAPGQPPAVADIAVMHADGTSLRLLTGGTGNYGFPSWSGDGRRIVYRSSENGGGHLHILDVESGKSSQLATGGDHENFPSWSPSSSPRGERIVFTSLRNGDYELYSIKPDGSGLRQLTHSPGNDAHASWSPDGKWIVFASTRRGFKDESALHPYNPQPSGDLYVMRADGTNVRQLTDDQFEEATPAWIGK